MTPEEQRKRNEKIIEKLNNPGMTVCLDSYNSPEVFYELAKAMEEFKKNTGITVEIISTDHKTGKLQFSYEDQGDESE